MLRVFKWESTPYVVFYSLSPYLKFQRKFEAISDHKQLACSKNILKIDRGGDHQVDACVSVM